MPLLAGEVQAGRFRPVGDDADDLGRIGRVRLAAAISAAMLEPRPEIRTAMRFLEVLIARSSPVDDAGVAARHDAADRRHRLAGFLQHGRDLRRLAGSNDEHHADAAIEGAHHLFGRDAAGLCQPGEHRRDVDRVEVEFGGKILGQHARNVFRKAAAGDVRQRLDAMRVADGA